MAVKILGLMAIFIACTAAGLLKSAGLSKRVRQLEAFIGAIREISTEIRYLASPVDDLMKKISSLDEYKELQVFGLCEKNLPLEKDFSKAWARSIEEAKPALALEPGDYETLGWFGKVLGTTDVEGQTAICERYTELLFQRLSRAREEKAKRGRLYSSLGVLAGIFLVVIFL